MISFKSNGIVKLFSTVFWTIEASTVVFFLLQTHRTDFGIGDSQMIDMSLLVLLIFASIPLLTASVFAIMESKMWGLIFSISQLVLIVIMSNIYISNVYIISIVGPGLGYFAYYMTRTIVTRRRVET